MTPACREPRTGRVPQLPPAPYEHAGECLGDDGAGHLGCADGAAGERDGDLGDRESEADGAPGVLDLEAVAVGGRGDRPDAFECVAAECLEPGGGVVHRESEDEPDVDVPAP